MMAKDGEERKSILTESGTNELEIIEFHLKKQLPDGREKIAYYGINVAKVREVIRVPETTDYPNAQRHMVGLFPAGAPDPAGGSGRLARHQDQP